MDSSEFLKLKSYDFSAKSSKLLAKCRDDNLYNTSGLFKNTFSTPDSPTRDQEDRAADAAGGAGGAGGAAGGAGGAGGAAGGGAGGADALPFWEDVDDRHSLFDREPAPLAADSSDRFDDPLSLRKEDMVVWPEDMVFRPQDEVEIDKLVNKRKHGTDEKCLHKLQPHQCRICHPKYFCFEHGRKRVPKRKHNCVQCGEENVKAEREKLQHMCGMTSKEFEPTLQKLDVVIASFLASKKSEEQIEAKFVKYWKESKERIEAKFAEDWKDAVALSGAKVDLLRRQEYEEKQSKKHRKSSGAAGL